jgi:hypothetical protein
MSRLMPIDNWSSFHLLALDDHELVGGVVTLMNALRKVWVDHCWVNDAMVGLYKAMMRQEKEKRRSHDQTILVAQFHYLQTQESTASDNCTDVGHSCQ